MRKVILTMILGVGSFFSYSQSHIQFYTDISLLQRSNTVRYDQLDYFLNAEYNESVTFESLGDRDGENSRFLATKREPVFAHMGLKVSLDKVQSSWGQVFVNLGVSKLYEREQFSYIEAEDNTVRTLGGEFKARILFSEIGLTGAVHMAGHEKWGLSAIAEANLGLPLNKNAHIHWESQENVTQPTVSNNSYTLSMSGYGMFGLAVQPTFFLSSGVSLGLDVGFGVYSFFDSEYHPSSTIVLPKAGVSLIKKL